MDSFPPIVRGIAMSERSPSRVAFVSRRDLDSFAVFSELVLTTATDIETGFDQDQRLRVYRRAGWADGDSLLVRWVYYGLVDGWKAADLPTPSWEDDILRRLLAGCRPLA